MAKEFLSRRDVAFREVHVFEEPGAVDDVVALTGSLAAPVVMIGKKFLRGYDPVSLEKLLKEADLMEEESI